MYFLRAIFFSKLQFICFDSSRMYVKYFYFRMYILGCNIELLVAISDTGGTQTTKHSKKLRNVDKMPET